MSSGAANEPRGNGDDSPQFSAIEIRAVWILGLLLVIVGLAIVADFGQSTDEYADFLYAEDAMRAYAGSSAFTGHRDRQFYGPIHIEFAFLLGEIAERLSTTWTVVEGRHLANYLVFVAGTISFYFLSRRFLHCPGATISTLLYVSQPLFFGNGFINQKDTPFLSYFVLSLTLGLYAIDALEDHVQRDSPKELLAAALADFKRLSRIRQAVFGLCALLILSVVLDFIMAGFTFRWAEAHLINAYNGSAWEPIQRVFAIVARDSYKTPIGAYLSKLRLIYSWIRVPIGVGLLSLLWFLARRNLPGFVQSLSLWSPGGLRRLALAGIVLGMATSVRVAAPLAGILISLRLVRARRWKSVFLLLIYWGVAASVCYVAWPHLWRGAIAGFWQVVRIMSDFPSRPVLYLGQYYSSHELPWHLFPVLVGIQLTETVVIGFPIGLVLVLTAADRIGFRRSELDILLLWLGIPAASVMLLHRPIYDNLRQVLFSLPPIVLIASVGLHSLVRLVSHRYLRAIVVAAALLPGLLGMIRSHPYEYSYYNSFVGGFSGASGKFYLDVWCTSLREAMGYVNEVAPMNARIGVSDAAEAARRFAREDLDVSGLYRREPNTEYVVICRDTMRSPNRYLNYQTVFEVKKWDAVLATIMVRKH